MPRRTRSRATPAAFLAAALAGCGDTSAGGETPADLDVAAPPKHLVLIVVDTLRYDTLSQSGYFRETSPALDAFLAERAVAFDEARATSPWTKPSVATLMTGLRPREHGVTRHAHKLHSQIDTLAEVLAARGFETAAFQSNILLAHVFGYAQGFEFYDDSNLASHRISTGEEVNAAALGWLDIRPDPERPLFLYVHHYEPHFDYLEWSEIDWYPEDTGRLTGHEEMEALTGAVSQMTEPELAALRARYDGEVRVQDRMLDDLLRGLEEHGVLDDALVVVTADHGEEFREHGELAHQMKLYDELLRVPLLVARPGEPEPGRRLDARVSQLDLPATVLDLLGVEGEPLPGRSFAGLLDGHGADLPPQVAHAAKPVSREGEEGLDFIDRDAVVVGGWKLLRDARDGSRELYDLAADPGEQVDRAADEPARVAELEAILDAYLAETRRDGPELEPELAVIDDETTARLRELGYL